MNEITWVPSSRVPDPSVRELDPRFAHYRLAHAKVERLGTGLRWAEGPAWFADARFLLFTDLPNDRIMRWDETTGGLECLSPALESANA